MTLVVIYFIHFAKKLIREPGWLSVIKPLHFGFGDDDLSILVGYIYGMTGPEAGILQPFTAQLNNRERYIRAVLPLKCFIAYGQSSCFDVIGHSKPFMRQINNACAPYPTW
jgi:hypothetical protein